METNIGKYRKQHAKHICETNVKKNKTNMGKYGKHMGNTWEQQFETYGKFYRKIYDKHLKNMEILQTKQGTHRKTYRKNIGNNIGNIQEQI